MSDDGRTLAQDNPHLDQEDHWISLSDLMTGLMMIFMLIAIAFMLKIEQASSKMKDAAVQYQQMMVKLQEQSARMRQAAELYDVVRRDLYQSLMHEFGKDLPKWDAEITPNLTVRFRNPDILFNTGQDELKPKFKDILRDFFPRYIKIVTSSEYEPAIQEIRIEGHTSSIWAAPVSPEEAYFRNMALSQARTRSTLRFVLELPQMQSEAAWLRKHVTANGLSSSHLILHPDGTEDVQRSQRVEFHIRTDADVWMDAIRDSLK